MLSDISLQGGDLLFGSQSVSTIRRRLSISVAVSGWLGFAVAVFALIVIAIVFGWEFGIPAVVRLEATYAGMALSTAVCFLIGGFAVFYRAFFLGSGSSPVCLAAGAAVAGIAGVNLAALIAGQEAGIELYLMQVAGLPPTGAYMPSTTSVCFILVGLCIAIQQHGAGQVPATIYSWTATAGIVIALVALVGYLYDVERLYQIDIYAVMAGYTALGFAMLFAALHLVRPTWGWMRVLIASGPGSEALRMLLPGVLAAPIFFTWLSLTSVEGGAARSNTFLAVVALGCAAFLVFLLFRSTLRLNRQMQVHRATSLRLNQALTERDLLLSEVYHRVKNNLQFMDAMLAIEGSKLADADAVNVLQTVRSRLYSLSRVHSRLLGSHDLATVDLAGLLTDICEDLAAGAGIADSGIRLEPRIAHVTVDWERAIPIALLANELVTNAIKHAFPDGRGGTIAVEVEAGRHRLRMCVRDDGVGEGGVSEALESAGALIIGTLVHQLDATMKTTTSDGTAVTIDIPATHA